MITSNLIASCSLGLGTRHGLGEMAVKLDRIMGGRFVSKRLQYAPPGSDQIDVSLPERERKVIELRFGLSGTQPCTLEEVGQAFGVTRERIRQIENNTLKKLESLPEAQRLRDAC